MNNLSPSLQRAINEWERLLLTVVLLVFCLAGGYFAVQLMGLLEDESPRPSGGSLPKPLFSDAAFAFVNRDTYRPRANPPHAFSLPAGARVKEKPKPAPPPEPPKLTGTDDDQGAGDAGGTLTVQQTTPQELVPREPPKKEPDVQAVPKAQDPPRPRVKDFITYRGFMDVDGTTNLAYLQHEKDSGRGKASSSSKFISSGKRILGMRVVEFNEQQLVLEDAAGEKHTIRKGARFEVEKKGGGM